MEHGQDFTIMQISLRRTVLKDDAKHLRKVPPRLLKKHSSARCNFKLTDVISSSKITREVKVTFWLIFGRYAIMMHLTDGIRAGFETSAPADVHQKREQKKKPSLKYS